MCAFAFFMCTHIHDNSVPLWADSDDAIAFVSEVLNLNPMDLLTKFEQWACARTKCVYHALSTIRNIDKYHQLAGGVQENLQTMRHDCTCLIVNGLHK
jgi:succinate dehydrogenase/fumarate reductase cytochrome b subunit